MVFACPFFPVSDAFLPVSDAFESPVFVGPEVAAPEPLPGFAVPDAFPVDTAVPLALAADFCAVLEAFAVSDAVPQLVSLMVVGKCK